METIRLFIGIELPDEVKAAITAHVETLKNQFPDLRVGWEGTEKLHLTLKFLGDVDTEKIIEIKGALDEIASAFQVIRAEIDGPGSFGSSRAPRVLWLRIGSGADEIKQINSEMELRLATLGLHSEKRAFSPHITIARIKEPHRSAELAERHLELEFGPIEFYVGHISLVRSELKPTGSIYTVVSRHPLN